MERASSEENLWEKRVRRDGWHRGDGAVCGPRAQARWNAVAGDVRWHRGPAARRAASAAAPVRASAHLPQPREARGFGRLQRRALRPGRRRTTVGGRRPASRRGTRRPNRIHREAPARLSTRGRRREARRRASLAVPRPSARALGQAQMPAPVERGTRATTPTRRTAALPVRPRPPPTT